MKNTKSTKKTKVHNKRYNNNRYKKQIYRPQRGLTRSIMPFTRETETYFRLNDLTGASGILENMVHTTDGGAAGQIQVKLNQFAGYTDFTNLFKQYKLNYIQMTFYPAGNMTATGETRDEGGPRGNNNVLIRVMRNQTAIAIGTGNTISEWSQLQAKKQWLLAQDKPTSFGCKLSLRTAVEPADVAVGPSKYITTNDADVPHQGVNIRFDSLDGRPINQTDNIWPAFRVVSKLYFTCKGVA